MEAIDALDLEPIKVKLMHQASGEGWSLERANAVEVEYRRFLHLMQRYPNEQTAPLADVDTFWHYHILDTLKYAADCDAVFGYFLHHFPYIGMRGDDDAAELERLGQRMAQLYEATFGEPYRRAGERMALAAVAPGAAQETAFCGITPGAPQATAFCGITPGAPQAAAFCGITPGAQLGRLYTERPRLAS